ncbi:MAG: hypothetical protein A3H36_10075 [Chloroflexi bacterium RIFCSPLOWO2_02_FULL_71_16]|nr:MAG: hypothetical protein A3H36_10075 [Chloroflexi bacterium RIFCSPLOWO2_02_FULL_71_16]
MRAVQPGPTRRRRPADGAHRTPRPLPEPPRSHRVSTIGRRPLDRLGKLLEEWLAELPLGYTYSGE